LTLDFQEELWLKSSRFLNVWRDGGQQHNNNDAKPLACG